MAAAQSSLNCCIYRLSRHERLRGIESIDILETRASNSMAPAPDTEATAASKIGLRLRPIAMTRSLLASSVEAIARSMPRVAPARRTLRIVSHELAALVTASARTKRMMAGTLCAASSRWHEARISDSTSAAVGAGCLRTTSATTMAPTTGPATDRLSTFQIAEHFPAIGNHAREYISEYFR